MTGINKTLATILIFLSLFVVLASPLWAQEAGTAERLYCPYCGMANLISSKFCRACGSLLPHVTPTPSPLANDSINAVRLFAPALPAQASRNDSLKSGISGVTWNEPSLEPQGSAPGSAAAGLVAGFVGFWAGGFAGYGIDKATSEDHYEDFDGLYGFVIGAPVGESLLLPVGVHIANGRRGKLPPAILASMAIAGAGIAMAAAAGNAKILLAIPVAQLVACTTIERSTGRSD